MTHHTIPPLTTVERDALVGGLRALQEFSYEVSMDPILDIVNDSGDGIDFDEGIDALVEKLTESSTQESKQTS